MLRAAAAPVRARAGPGPCSTTIPRVSIYLDNNATTRPLGPVADAMDRANRELWHNPSSIHRPGQAARGQIELARKHLAALIGVRPRFITLVGSGTEAIDLAVRGTLQRFIAAGLATPPSIITSRIEHSAVRELAEAMQTQGRCRVHWLDLGPDGVVTVDAVARLLDADPHAALVSVQWANNETGAVHPTLDIAALCRARGVVMHCDATQWVGKMPAPPDEAPRLPDLVTFSPHKFHGPKGVGVLYARAGVPVSPQIHGEQELGRRGGTENTPGILGAGVAAQLALAWLADDAPRAGIAALRDRFEGLVLAGFPGAVVNGPRDLPGQPPGTLRLYNTSNIGFPRLEAEALLLLLSERGVCASAGAACSSGSLDPSPVLRAMGVPAHIAHGSLRFSLSRETTREEVDAAAAIVIDCASRLNASMAGLPG